MSYQTSFPYFRTQYEKVKQEKIPSLYEGNHGFTFKFYRLHRYSLQSKFYSFLNSGPCFCFVGMEKKLQSHRILLKSYITNIEILYHKYNN